MKKLLLSLILVFTAVACVDTQNSNNNNNNSDLCGNSVIDPNEVCDQSNVASRTCEDEGFDRGVLMCNSDCQGYDTSFCSYNTNNTNNTNTNNTNNTNWVPPTNSRVYVNTKEKLYYIDPGVSAEMVEVGTFTGIPDPFSGFYDIAVNDQGIIYGISEDGLYQIDKDTAACTLYFEFPIDSPHFFALSYVKGADPENPDKDILIGASAEDGEWVQIEPDELNVNVFIHLGYYDFPDYFYVSSGDIVSFQTGFDTYKTYATLKCGSSYNESGCESDWLAEIDPETGDARLIGQTEYQQIFALGFWGDKLYGFTKNGDYILINTETAASELVESYTDRLFWGAGNTTRPYIVQ